MNTELEQNKEIPIEGRVVNTPENIDDLPIAVIVDHITYNNTYNTSYTDEYIIEGDNIINNIRLFLYVDLFLGMLYILFNPIYILVLSVLFYFGNYVTLKKYSIVWTRINILLLLLTTIFRIVSSIIIYVKFIIVYIDCPSHIFIIEICLLILLTIITIIIYVNMRLFIRYLQTLTDDQISSLRRSSNNIYPEEIVL